MVGDEMLDLGFDSGLGVFGGFWFRGLFLWILGGILEDGCAGIFGGSNGLLNT
jgi:hypothetical protein